MKVSYGVLRKILLTKVEDNSLFKLPKDQEITLGIDEHARLKKKLATTITLIKPQKQLLGIIAKSTSQATKEWIDNNFSLEERLRIKEICVDMTKSLKKPLQLAFPEAKFTIDKFHVVAYLNNLIKEEYSFSSKYGLREKDKRKLPQRTKAMHISRILAQDGNSWDKKKKDKVKTVFSLMPRVAELWYAKEEVRAIYKECLDKKEARDRWQFVLKLMPEVAKSTLAKHLEEILNYFDTYNTNAFTEGVHTKIKKQKRVSYGIKNPEIYVKKMELAFIPKEKLILPHTF
ncbi:MAG: transposase [Candidatus Pacebacteria bacterium]|nr:transposase [Candidatus Paceibacterota bacterium]